MLTYELRQYNDLSTLLSPQVSFVSKIVPSPDWFIGVDSLELCENGHWLNSVDVKVTICDGVYTRPVIKNVTFMLQLPVSQIIVNISALWLSWLRTKVHWALNCYFWGQMWSGHNVK